MNFWDELAEISLEYLKPRDIIYVSGTLGTYDRVNDFGENEMHYQVGTCSLCYLFFFVVAYKAMSSSSITSAFGSKEGTVGSFFLSMKCIGLVTFGV